MNTKKDLVAPNYSCNDDDMDVDERKLVYYKKGDVIWGSPLIINDIKRIKDMLNISMFPNPASDYVNIRLDEKSTTEYGINLYDPQGRCVKSLQLPSNHGKIDISNLKDGIYLLKVKNKQGRVTMEKLIIQKNP